MVNEKQNNCCKFVTIVLILNFCTVRQFREIESKQIPENNNIFKTQDLSQ